MNDEFKLEGKIELGPPQPAWLPATWVDEEGNVQAIKRREWFAGLAMQGIISRPSGHSTYGEIVDSAVHCADRLIKELEGVDVKETELDAT